MNSRRSPTQSPQSHAFSGAVCLATVCIASPNSPLTPPALAQVDETIALFRSAQSSQRSVLLGSNLKTLLWLRRQCGSPTLSAGEGDEHESEDHLRLIGWRTRLVAQSTVEQSSVRDEGEREKKPRFGFPVTPGGPMDPMAGLGSGSGAQLGEEDLWPELPAQDLVSGSSVNRHCIPHRLGVPTR